MSFATMAELVQGMRFKLSRAQALAGSNPAGSKYSFS